ncbi:hypothetical protein ASG25_01375 [Rhizobium sp. Leaf384]|uniref:ArnT family glycosyltransferase n=1 Tax=unclassified Rhizobium TaxID=2613769 RepID=UPI0007127B3D|nr:MULTISPECIES: glycosyltransferase family 39 protein [unclassified Rhizobium]KQS74108.1 hypothetical protein ASG58_16440 [Rhizobium sp. Leaf383]KQS80303.1 hypothetical protein ASG25_01375 [Rhizobium sp. Leaf384]
MTSSRAVLLILALTAYRILLLAFDRTDLFVDEAQYWMWSQHLDFGYYSKPPMIAWVIHLTTALGGSDSRFWIRLSSPLLHGATALALMHFARTVTRSARIAAWSGVTFVTLPGVALSSVFVSTDTSLLFFYALAALATARLSTLHAVRADVDIRMGIGGYMDRPGERADPAPGRPPAPMIAPGMISALGLGLAIGLGLLSKYAMLYFPVTAALAAHVVRRSRLRWQHAAIATLVAFMTVLPNLVWNARHGGATFRHTSDNIGWSGFHLHVDRAAGFFAAQFGVVGPVIFAAMIAALILTLRGRGTATDRQLVILSWPIIGLLVVQALMSRAYANWAATAYVAGVVLAVCHLDATWKRGLWISLALNGAVAVALPLLCAFPETHLPGQPPILNRYLGRSALSLSLADQARAEGLTTIVAEDRDILADLVYTLRGSEIAVRARPTGQPPRNSYEQDRTYAPLQDGPRVLLVTDEPFACMAGAVKLPATIRPQTGFLQGRVLTSYAADGRCLRP